MGSYNLSARAQLDLVGTYKYGKKMFGQEQASTYPYESETILEELAERPEPARYASFIAHALKHYRYRAHVVFYQIDDQNQIYVVRVLGNE